MKGICCVLLLVCCIVFLCSEVGAIAVADDSHQQIGVRGESEGNTENARIPDWVPQPIDIERVEEQRLLAAVAAAQKTLAAAPKDATAWGQLGNIYFVHGWLAEAAKCYQSAAEIAPNEFRWSYYFGMTTYKSDPHSASETLAAAIKLDPQYAPAHVYRAAALRSIGAPWSKRKCTLRLLTHWIRGTRMRLYGSVNSHSLPRRLNRREAICNGL